MVVKIQSLVRGFLYRIKHLPLILYIVQQYLQRNSLKLNHHTNDGRVNSSLDEDSIITLLKKKYHKRMKLPNIRMWYDMLLYDRLYGWIPVNIKSTTMKTRDNTGNLAMCVYAYTDENLILDKNYHNGKMSKVLFQKLKFKKYNQIYKKDYYFIVINKHNTKDIIINSVKGLTTLYPNINNLPYQVCWDKNRTYQYRPLHRVVQLFIDCLKINNPGWKNIFMDSIKLL
jgi:hypothetical protein